MTASALLVAARMYALLTHTSIHIHAELPWYVWGLWRLQLRVLVAGFGSRSAGTVMITIYTEAYALVAARAGC